MSRLRLQLNIVRPRAMGGVKEEIVVVVGVGVVTRREREGERVEVTAPKGFCTQ